ncbi:unnamed protein product, partial [Didymodactylos carnosus]
MKSKLVTSTMMNVTADDLIENVSPDEDPEINPKIISTSGVQSCLTFCFWFANFSNVEIAHVTGAQLPSETEDENFHKKLKQCIRDIIQCTQEQDDKQNKICIMHYQNYDLLDHFNYINNNNYNTLLNTTSLTISLKSCIELIILLKNNCLPNIEYLFVTFNYYIMNDIQQMYDDHFWEELNITNNNNLSQLKTFILKNILFSDFKILIKYFLFMKLEKLELINVIVND